MHFQLNSAMSKNKPGVPFHKLQNCISSHQKGKIGSKKVSHDARLTERVREVVKKTNILQLQEFPTPSYCRCCSVTKRSDSGIAKALKALKMHFETPHNEIKCVFSIIESYYIEKKRVQIFTFSYSQG